MVIERRIQPRADLRVPVFLLALGSDIPIQTETENIGIDGFFCYSTCFLSPGESVKFLLVLPSAPVEPEASSGIRVHGEAEITRVSVGPAHLKYGVACRLRSYRVLPASDDLSLDEVLANFLRVWWTPFSGQKIAFA